MVATAFGPDELRQLRVDRVVGVRRRLGEGDRPEVGVLVVADRPELVAERDQLRPRHERRGGGDPVLERGREHERLERRARLPLCLHGEVELALAEVPAADHRQDRAVARIERDERGRRPELVVEPLGDRAPRDALEPEVDRRRHAQPAAEDAARVEAVDQLLLDVVREVRRDDRLHGRWADVLALGQRRGRRDEQVAAVDLPLLEEVAQHEVSPRPRGSRVRERVVAR